VVAADDRTGAFEVAALFAAVVGPVVVSVGQPVTGPCVVDIRSRDVTPQAAAARAAAIEAQPSTWTAHKMDSTLRGNWAVEVSARRARTGRRLVVLPGWPELGRTCIGGSVFVHGAAIGSVLEPLPGATSVGSVDGLRAWLAGDDPIAVCDVPDTATMHALAATVASTDVLVAGPAGPLGAVFAARAGTGPGAPGTAPTIDGPVLVVCGSANPVSRIQVARLAAARPDVVVMTAPDAQGPLHVGVAQHLAVAADRAATDLGPTTVIIIGGDTAAAFLGDEPRRIGGMVAAGMPWSRAGDDGGPLVVTKAGGFGGPDALVALLSPRSA